MLVELAQQSPRTCVKTPIRWRYVATASRLLGYVLWENDVNASIRGTRSAAAWAGDLRTGEFDIITYTEWDLLVTFQG